MSLKEHLKIFNIYVYTHIHKLELLTFVQEIWIFRDKFLDFER